MFLKFNKENSKSEKFSHSGMTVFKYIQKYSIFILKIPIK